MLSVPLTPTAVRSLIALANRAPSVHNSQPWRWRPGPASVLLSADPARALPATDPEGRDLLVSCGAALHHLQVALRAAGASVEVHRFPDPARPQLLAAVEVGAGIPDDDDRALAAAIERRRSDRRVFSPRPVPEPLLAELTRAAAAAGARLVVLEAEAQWSAARLVERAAAEQAGRADLAREVAAWTGRAPDAADGVPAANVPGDLTAAVPVRSFAGHAMPQSPQGRLEEDGTRLAVLTTVDDGPVDRLRAGEALSAVLLTATRAGLASCPLSQPLEVAGTRARLAADCLPEGLAPQLLLRLGWAPVGAPPVPATGRRPVVETIDDPGVRGGPAEGAG